MSNARLPVLVPCIRGDGVIPSPAIVSYRQPELCHLQEAMFKVNAATILWKCLSVHGSRQAVTGSYPSGSLALKNAINISVLSRDFVTNNPSAGDATDSGNATDSGKAITLPSPPKRAPNVFALYVKTAFKRMPAEMPLKEKFILAAEEWRVLSEDQKDEYKKEMTDGLIRYRQEMSSFLESLSPEALVEFKKLRKEKIKDKTRSRIKSKLRKLNYPKKPCSGYIFFIRDQLRKEYPDGNYPPVRTPQHIRSIGIWSQRWRAMNVDERKPFADQAEADRKRYYEELEKWKHDLAKPENEENLLQLERMSRKIENANKSDEEVKKKQRKVAGKIIRARLDKKAGKTKKSATKKKTATAKAKPLKASTKKPPAKKTSKKSATEEE